MNFLVIDATGLILRKGSCPDSMLAQQARAGQTAIEDTWEGTSDLVHKIVNSERVEFTPEPASAPPIAAQREAVYPPIGDQIDALWHAMDEGLLPKVPAFYDPIKAVKSKLPK